MKTMNKDIENIKYIKNEDFIKLLYPYLGIRRRLKIKEILNKSHAS